MGEEEKRADVQGGERESERGALVQNALSEIENIRIGWVLIWFFESYIKNGFPNSIILCRYWVPNQSLVQPAAIAR